MLIRLILALAALVGLWWAVRWFGRAKPAQVARLLKTLGLALLVAGGLFLVLTGKLAGLVAVLAGLAPWIARAMRLHGLYRMLRGLGVRMSGGKPSPGAASEVQTRFLHMHLDHDSGSLDGEVLEGPLAGRLLSSLSRDQALELWRLVQVDPQSAQVLEAWLERAFPDWREAGPSAPPSGAGTMTRDEAWEVLGLKPGVAPEEIRDAHRRLMRAAHPDAGGSTWLAARINQARDLLLGD
ncbi:MAG: molecular chaperone DnaJ [Actinomycetota bacterium]